MAAKKTRGGGFVALRATAIDGVHFKEGETVTGVDAEQLAAAVRMGVVADAAKPAADADAAS
jgi:hypothetical protein